MNKFYEEIRIECGDRFYDSKWIIPGKFGCYPARIKAAFVVLGRRLKKLVN